MDLFFDAVNPAGEKGFVKCNDMVFDYFAYRKEYPEYFCIELINAIKKCTGKKAAIIFEARSLLSELNLVPSESLDSINFLLERISSRSLE